MRPGESRKLEAFGGTVSEMITMKSPGATVTRPFSPTVLKLHRTLGGRPFSVSSQPPGWGIACTMWKRSVKLKRRGNASFGRDFPLRVRFQIMFCNNLLTCDRVSGKWDNADANYEEKKNHWCLEKMSWTMLNLTRQNSKSVEHSKRCFERKQQRGRANAS